MRRHASTPEMAYSSYCTQVPGSASGWIRSRYNTVCTAQVSSFKFQYWPLGRDTPAQYQHSSSTRTSAVRRTLQGLSCLVVVSKSSTSMYIAYCKL